MQWLNRAMLKLRIENISDREDTDMSTWKEYTVADVISKVIDYRGKTPKNLVVIGVIRDIGLYQQKI